MSWDQSKFDGYELRLMYKNWCLRNKDMLYRFYIESLGNKSGELKLEWNEEATALQILNYPDMTEIILSED